MFPLGIGIIVFLLLGGIPIFIAFGAGASFLSIEFVGLPTQAILHLTWSGIADFTLLAVPFFILAGYLMAEGGPSRYLVELVDRWVGHLPGGLALACVLATMFFSSMSGSSPATAATMGSIMIPEMTKYSYPKKFSMGLIATAGTLGILIPPSVVMVIYCVATGLSIGKQFMAGFLPGLLAGVALMVTAVFIAWRGKYGTHPPYSWRSRWQAVVKALPALLTPVIILGGIYSGIFTPTESAAVACVYAFLVSGFVYRELTITKLRKALLHTVLSTCMVFMIITMAKLFGKSLSFAQVPQIVTDFVAGYDIPLAALLMAINVLYLAMGTVLETMTILYVTVPIFLPILMGLGLDPIHFGIIFIINIEIALVTPPVGFNLYVISGVAEEPIDRVARGALPFIYTMIIVLLIITYVPQVSLFLPSLFYK